MLEIGLTEKQKEEKKAKSDALKTRSFRDFMDQPLTRMAVSMLPPDTGKSDTLSLLLSAAFDAGIATGQTGLMEELAVSLFEAKKNRSDS